MGHGEYVCCRSKRRTHPHSRTGAFATLKENQRFSEPDGFKSIRTVSPYSKKAQDVFLCFLLVTRTGLEPMKPP